MIKSCVIGWPISHSRSPIIHGYWLRELGIDGSYTRVPVEPANLRQFLETLSRNGYAGCNVTLPHKEGAFSVVTPADEPTKRLGAVNTVYLQDGKPMGTNTDGEGFINSLKASTPDFTIRNRRAVVLGAGGAALAIVNALVDQGAAEIVVANRSLDRAESLRQRFGAKIKPIEWFRRADQLGESHLLVNTTSLGMKGQEELEIDMSRLPADATVTDIVYVPLQTRLLQHAAERGNSVVGGLGMLLHQAVRGFELWFGVRPVVTMEVHDLIARDIDPGYRT